jgi:hypothetical protein
MARLEAGRLTGASSASIKLTSGTSIFWDLQAITQATPIASQIFTLAAEPLNLIHLAKILALLVAIFGVLHAPGLKCRILREHIMNKKSEFFS